MSQLSTVGILISKPNFNLKLIYTTCFVKHFLFALYKANTRNKLEEYSTSDSFSLIEA